MFGECDHLHTQSAAQAASRKSLFIASNEEGVPQQAHARCIDFLERHQLLLGRLSTAVPRF